MSMLDVRPFNRMPWMADAACRGTNPDLFITDRGQATSEAKRICADCPVKQACADTALADPSLHGIWGGLSHRDRRRIRRQRVAANQRSAW
jgi:WhiB family redox-sensing transcriptional regulator